MLKVLRTRKSLEDVAVDNFLRKARGLEELSLKNCGGLTSRAFQVLLLNVFKNSKVYYRDYKIKTFNTIRCTFRNCVPIQLFENCGFR